MTDSEQRLSHGHRPRAASSTPRETWPAAFRASPLLLLTVLFGWLAAAWSAVVVVDLAGLIQLRGDFPLWYLLFADRPVEWTTWLVLSSGAIFAAYLSARLDTADRRGAARFFLLLAVSLGLRVIEDAGDVRLLIRTLVADVAGNRVLGVPSRVFADLPYFALLAAVPVYALARYGRYVWRCFAARRYLATGVVLYAVAVLGSVARLSRGGFVRVGRFLAERVLGGRFPLPDCITPSEGYSLLVGGVILESLEFAAAALLLVAVATFATEYRHGRLAPEFGDRRSFDQAPQAEDQ